MMLFSVIVPRVLKFLKVDVKVKNNNYVYDHTKRYIFVNLNQQSLIGSFGISATFPQSLEKSIFYLVNAKFAYLVPVWGWLLAKNAVIVWRNISWSRKSALARCIAKIKEGKSLYMSIEGQRTRDNSLLPYQRGAAIIAITTQTPIIGIVIHDSFELMPYGSIFVKPGTITYELLPPLYPDKYTLDNAHLLTQTLRDMALISIADHAAQKNTIKSTF